MWPAGAGEAPAPLRAGLQNITKAEGAAEWARFAAYFRALAEGRPGSVGERLPAKHCAANFWIVKPGYLNQARRRRKREGRRREDVTRRQRLADSRESSLAPFHVSPPHRARASRCTRNSAPSRKCSSP